MKRGDRVRVRLLANVENWKRGRIGTVAADSLPGEAIQVEFDGEAMVHQFRLEDFDLI